MQQISGREAALAVLTGPAFAVPPVPHASAGVAWLRDSVARFSSGTAHDRRRALVIALLDAIPVESLQAADPMHPVAHLARAVGADDSIVDLVRDVAQAYRPGTGDDARADAAVDRLVAVFGGVFDEATAARIGLLVQACEPTAALIERTMHRPVHEVLQEDPPVPATSRQALAATIVGDVTIEAGEVVQVSLADDLAFGAGAHACPVRAHALALTGQALAAGTP
ncbi:MAG TPA: hypothetical protein VGI58_19555 [Streptosporangiaceae bacterium]